MAPLLTTICESRCKQNGKSRRDSFMFDDRPSAGSTEEPTTTPEYEHDSRTTPEGEHDSQECGTIPDMRKGVGRASFVNGGDDVRHIDDDVELDSELGRVHANRRELRRMTSAEFRQRALNFVARCDDEESIVTPTDPKQAKKGALTGVFIPTCENMWGVLIFLRFNYVVGVAGIGYALLTVFLSFIAALATTSSLSACVSSGGVVSRGGPYHMISRTTSPSVGASVGLMYFLGITMLAVLETLGAIETIFLYDQNMNFGAGATQAWGTVLFLCLAMVVYGGINIVTKTGILFFFVALYTILSFYLGFFMVDKDITYKNETIHLGLDPANLRIASHFTPSVGFGDMLAVFFPCFTGILSGADRADVLRNPSRDIIQGTFCAVCVSFVMYVSFMVLWACVTDSYEYLSGEYGDILGTRVAQTNLYGHRLLSSAGGDASYVILDVPWNPFRSSVYIGIIISSCAQALQCMVVAPKLLQGISADNVIPLLRWFAPLSRNEPKRALVATYTIGAILVLVGSLDIIAPLLSMCFLVAYTFINFSCLLLTYMKALSWRPDGMDRKRYRVVYIGASLIGIIVCVGIMFCIHYAWAFVAIGLGIALLLYADWAQDKIDWGSGVYGMRYHLAMSSVQSLEYHMNFQINWRPQMLILFQINVANELEGIKEHGILKFCSQLRKGLGMYIAAAVLEGKIDDPENIHKARSEKLIIQNIMREEKMQGFADVVVAPTWASGVNYCVQLCGLGGMTPNTVVMEWPSLPWTRRELWPTLGSPAKDFVGIMRVAQADDKALLAVKGLESFPEEIPQSGNIDIWWMIHDGGMLIILSWLLRQHRLWRACHLRIFTIMEDVSEYEARLAATKLSNTLRDQKLFDVEVDVILIDDGMIEPYTKDWTLKVETRKMLLKELRPDLHAERTLPVDLDDLFPQSEEPATHGKLPMEEDVHVQDKRDQCSTKVRHAHNFRRAVSQEIAHTPIDEPCAPRQNKTQDPLGRAHTKDSVLSFASPNPLYGFSPGTVALGNVDASTMTLDRMQHQFGASVPKNKEHQFGSEQLNEIIKEKSADSALVLLNLPDCWGGDAEQSIAYMAYCDTLTSGLRRVIFVRSAGHEVFDLN